ncbi:MAG: hypothetical protein J0L92_40605, partial [Deltaproteobacteria bacterium]|nr:hypothetical protein [Deltaproteobacteria bacterium]
VLACALSAVGLAAGALFFVPDTWLEDELARGAPPATSTPPATTTTSELGGPTGACDRAFACCDQFRRMIATEAACEVVHQYDQRPRGLCDQVRDTYRNALDQQGYDSSMCGH